MRMHLLMEACLILNGASTLLAGEAYELLPGSGYNRTSPSRRG